MKKIFTALAIALASLSLVVAPTFAATKVVPKKAVAPIKKAPTKVVPKPVVVKKVVPKPVVKKPAPKPAVKVIPKPVVKAPTKKAVEPTKKDAPVTSDWSETTNSGYKY